jgi:hypothetical protein
MIALPTLLVVALLLVLVAIVRARRPRPRRGICAAPRRLLTVMLISISLTLAPSCASTPSTPPTTTPPPIVTPADAHRAQVTKVLAATRKVGLVVEQVQAAEIALAGGGLVPGLTPAVHGTIQETFKRTAASVIAATSALAAAVDTTDPATVVTALRDGLKDLTAALHVLSDAHAQQLAGWLDTAAALIEIALL